MAVSRFNRPIQPRLTQNYVSQYVPMPLDAYVDAMSSKQAFRDNELAQGLDFQSDLLNMRAYGNADTQYLKGVQDKFSGYIDEIAEKDLTDPDIYNTLRSMIRTTSKDPNLKTIASSVAQYDAFQQRRQELLKKGGHAYNKANLFGAENALSEYAEGEGFRMGTLNVGDIHEGLDELSELKEYFDMMKASGGDEIKSLQNAGEIFYKQGWKGISQSRVKEQAYNSLGTLITSPVGQQISREYEMLKAQGGIPEGMDKKDYLLSKFLGVGMGYVHGESTTNMDAALNKKADKEEENASFTVNNLPFMKSAYDKGVMGEVSIKDGVISQKGSKLESLPIGITVDNQSLGRQVPNVSFNFFKELFGFGGHKKINTDDPAVAVTEQHLLREMPEYKNMSPEERIETLGDYIASRDAQTISGPVEVSKSSKFIKNYNNVFLPLEGSGDNRQLNLNAAALFEFIDQEGNVIPGSQLKEYMEDKEITSVNYTGSSQDTTSPTEYGSTLLMTGDGKPLLMRPSETDKAEPAYRLNRVFAARHANMFKNEFEYLGDKYSSTYLPDGTYKVERLDKGKVVESGIYQHVIDEATGKPDLQRIK